MGMMGLKRRSQTSLEQGESLRNYMLQLLVRHRDWKLTIDLSCVDNYRIEYMFVLFKGAGKDSWMAVWLTVFW